MRKRKVQQYTPEEFDAVVDLLRRDTQARQNIEAITGQRLSGMTPRQIFDLYQAVQKATEVKATIAAYGRASVLLDDARRDLEGRGSLEEELAAAREEIKGLKQVNGSMKRGLELQARQIENSTAGTAMAVYAEGTGR